MHSHIFGGLAVVATSEYHGRKEFDRLSVWRSFLGDGHIRQPGVIALHWAGKFSLARAVMVWMQKGPRLVLFVRMHCFGFGLLTSILLLSCFCPLRRLIQFSM